MEKETYYENYPLSIICSSTIITISSYALGTFISYLINPWLALGYIFLCLISLLVGIRFRCCFCYYYGKRCSSGLGKLAPLIFKKGDSSEFKNPKNLIPAGILDFITLLSPVIGAIILMIIRFSWLVLVLLVVCLIVAVLPGFFLRKNLFCKHCRQGEIGCPAYEGMQKGYKKEVNE